MFSCEYGLSAILSMVGHRLELSSSPARVPRPHTSASKAPTRSTFWSGRSHLELVKQPASDNDTQKSSQRHHHNPIAHCTPPPPFLLNDLPAKLTMAPKKNISTTPSPSAVPPTAAKPTTAVTSASGQPTRAANKPSTSNSSHVRNGQDLQQIGVGVWNNYVDKTSQRVKLLDAFLVFLMAVGLLQFVYCVIAGNFVS